MSKLIKFTNKGFYCEAGGFYIDPWKPVDKALITHAHSDHARWGHKSYLSSKYSKPILQYRLGSDINIQGLDFGESLTFNGVKISFHPSGHIVGASQIRLEKDGEVWVVSGDYKIEDDGISGSYEPIKCTHFISESTFGLPIFNWEPQQITMSKINEWWKKNSEQGITSVLLCYTLGKTQRIMANIDSSIGPIINHGSTFNHNKVIESLGIKLPKYQKFSLEISTTDLKKALVIAPSSVQDTSWLQHFYPYSIGEVSGWMQVRGIRKRSGVDKGFVLSDHADWKGLNWAVKESGAENIYLTHGYTSVFTKWLNESGYKAEEVNSNWDEGEE